MPYAPLRSLAGRAHTIIGAGTLGRRVAMMWLTNGEKVNLFDTNSTTLEEAKKYIDTNLASTIKKLVPNGRPGRLETFGNMKDALKGAWLVTEAIPEIKDAKIDLLGQLDKELGEDVIIATNSSSFMASELFEKVESKERVVNTHYYMPPDSNPVEIMPHAGTDERIVPLLLKESKRHGLVPYHVRKESVGLIANRIWAAIKRESLFVVAEGVAEPAEVNSLLKQAFGIPVFSAIDQVGLDVARDIEDHYLKVRNDITRTDATELLSKYIKEGKLGVKATHGFFDYDDDKKETSTEKGHTLMYLNIAKNSISKISANGGTDSIVMPSVGQTPDGIQVDPTNGKMYWTVMGSPKRPDGRICSANTDGTDLKDLIEPGSTHTPKQIQLKGDVLYWCDREGGHIMTCKTDGTDFKTLYDSAPGEERPLGDATKWCVGITVDTERDLLYWTQKGPSKGGEGRMFRMEIGKSNEIQTILHNLPEPIDLELDPSGETLYWTDRGDPPFGNTLNKISVSSPFDAKAHPGESSADQVIVDHLHEPIGLVGDWEKGLMYVAELDGGIWEVELGEGGGKRKLLDEGGYFTGIALV